MVTTKFYLDTRKEIKGGQGYSLRLNITYNRKTASFPLGISLKENQWNAVTRQVVNHPDAMAYNTYIASQKVAVDSAILRLADSGQLRGMTALQVRDFVVSKLNPEPEPHGESEKPEKRNDTLDAVFNRYIELKTKKSTRGLYVTTERRLIAFLGDEGYSTITFDDINKEWLLRFDQFLAQTAPSANSRSIYMRNLRTVNNFAIDCGLTSNYPFRRFTIKQQATRKRNYDADTMRRLWNYQCCEEWMQKYLDFFKLSFLLIGINCVDLCGLTEISRGRVEYTRSKTSKLYSIKLEPEAMELINQYRGEQHLLNFTDNYSDYRYFYNRMTKALRQLRDELHLKELTTYYARHTWATIAARLEIPKETIAAALGHSGRTVTDVYIEFDQRKVDEANRRVIDYVLYGKDYRQPQFDAPIIRPRRERIQRIG